MFGKISHNARIAITIIVAAIIGGGAVSANHVMQVNHQKKVASDRTKKEKENAVALTNYVVANGDTVESVAKKFKENVEYMKKKFNLNKDDQLIVGTKIVDQRAAIDKKRQDGVIAAAASAAQVAAQSQAVAQTSNNFTSHNDTSGYQASVNSNQVPTQSQTVVTQTPAQDSNQNQSNSNITDPSQMGAWQLMQGQLGK